MATITSTAYFSPTLIPGCQLWLDGADPAGTGVIPANGATVSTWTDKSGNANNATGGTSPTYSTTRQGLVFSTSASTYLQTSITAVPSTESIFCVFTPTSAALSANNDIFASSTNYGLGFQIVGNGTNFLLKYDIWAIAGYAPTGYTIVPGTRTLGSGTFSNPTATVYLSGGSSVGGPASTGGYPSGSGTRRVGSGAGGDYFNGTIHELIYFNVVLATSQRQQVEGYLAQKWALTASLPAGHPGLTSVFYKTLSFAPNQIPSCQVWLDAADPSTQTFSGSLLTAWLDKSQNAYNFNQLAGAPSGFTATNAVIGTSINGLRTLYFDPGASIKQSSTLDGVTNMFWVGRISSIGSGRNYFLFGHDSYYDWHSQVYPGKFCEDVSVCPAGIRNASPSALYTSDVAATTNANFSAISFPTAPNIFILSVSGITGSTRFQGLCYDRTNDHIGWCGDVGEVITFNSALTTSQIQQVESYLAQKWGMNYTLSASHPGLTYIIYKTPNVIKSTTLFSPTQIIGCQLWLDSSDTSTFTFTSGSNINTWIDKSASGLTATYAGTPPVLTKYNGYNAIQFSGANYLTTGTLSSGVLDSTGITYFTVATMTDTNGASQYSNAAVVIATASPEKVIRYNGGNCLYTINTSVLRGLANDYTSGVNCFVDTAASFYVYQNGTNTYSNLTAVTYAAQTTSTYFQIGNWGTSRFIGYMNEIIVFNWALPDAQRQQVEAYLAQKWGFGSSLPRNHPGATAVLSKSVAPSVINYFTPTQIPGCQLWLDASDASTVTGTVTTAFTETFSNAGVPTTSVYNGNGVGTGTPWAYLVGNASFYPYLTQGSCTWTNYGGISYGNSAFASDPTSVVSGSLGYSVFIQVNSATVSTLTRTTTVPLGQSCTVSFWYCSRDYHASPLSLSVKYGIQKVVTIGKPILSGTWTFSTTTFITSASSQNLVFTVTQDSTNPYYSGDQTANIALLKVTYCTAVQSSVTSVADKSGNGIVLSNATGFTYPNKTFNGTYPSFYCLGGGTTPNTNSNATLGYNAAFALTTPFTSFFVAHQDQGSSGYLMDSQSGSGREYTYNTLLNTPFGYSATNVSLSPCIITESWIAGTSILYINGISNYSGSLSSFTTGGIVIGNRYTLNESWPGHICEVIFYSGTLTTVQRQQVEAYLAQKWGLTSLLSSSSLGATLPLRPYFSPTYIGGLALWLDASDSTSITQDSSSNITQWTDKSSNGFNATLQTGSPKYISTGQKKYVNMNASQTLYISSFQYNTSWTVFSCMCNVTGGGRWYISPYGDKGIVMMAMNQGGNKIFNNIVVATDLSGAHIEVTSAQNTNGNAAYNYYRDGSNIASSTYTNNLTAGIVRLGIGGNGADGGGAGGIYNPFEIIIYNSYLSSNDRQTVEGYLAQKWGLTYALPASHPGLSVSLSQSSKFATIGLVYYVDAGISTSYPGSGSTWTDLAGSGITMTLYNSPTYSSANGGYISFLVASSQYAQSSAALSLLKNWSVEVWHYYTNTNNGYGGTIVGDMYNGNINFTLGGSDVSYTNLSPSMYLGGSSGWSRSSSYSLPSIGWYHIVGTYDGAFRKLYVNGALTTSDAVTVTAVADGVGFRFMRRWDGSGFDGWGGYLATVRIYSQALTATQIATNFNNSKSRFGIY